MHAITYHTTIRFSTPRIHRYILERYWLRLNALYHLFRHTHALRIFSHELRSRVYGHHHRAPALVLSRSPTLETWIYGRPQKIFQNEGGAKPFGTFRQIWSIFGAPKMLTKIFENFQCFRPYLTAMRARKARTKISQYFVWKQHMTSSFHQFQGVIWAMVA